MNLSDIAPDLRAPWLFLPRGRCRSFTAGHVAWAEPDGMGPRAGLDPTCPVRVETVPARPAEAVLEEMAGEVAAHAALHSPRLAVALDLVLALAAWDRAFRDVDLFPGNIYLAGEAGVGPVLRVSGRDLPPAVDAREILTELTRAELLYCFPVAWKFRGTYGSERQFRLNCWGRRLAHRLAEHEDIARVHARSLAETTAHLLEHRRIYAEHLRLLGDLDSRPAGAAWTSAAELPVGVLL
ncbi:hypothetical protein [Embleya sp. MST-111070]|uniref:hypothetical protein n=1 Tax=Embleya sp. MST-111070 TaxID=3398231 RepID=UPI003F741C68